MSRFFGIAFLTAFANAALSIDERVQNLHDMSMRQGIINLSTEKFNNYVYSKPRNYSFIVMTTALNQQRGCAICAEAHQEFKILYNSYRSGSQQEFLENKVFFGLVDYDDAAEVFSLLKLSSAPGFFHFPPSSKKVHKTDDKLDISRKGFQADAMSKWVADRTGVKINVIRPPSYTGLILIAVGGLICFGAAYMTGFQFEWLMNSRLWAAMSIFIILTMTSGQMWNHIRGPPPMGRQGNRMMFIANSSQMQYVFETYWVFVMYGMCSLGVILLGDCAGDITLDNGKRKLWGFTGVIMFIVFYSFILSTFRSKYQGYPYKLLF